ncbi:MAG: acyltransferase [Burkholderiales bacterium]|nr:acyltransferase [Burkholderiales bacterium]
MRILAAVTVLINHCFPLLGYVEPLGDMLGLTLGTISVDVFFVTSGFLVTGSLLAKKSAFEYICSRVLRIYPALIVVTLFSVFIIGTSLSDLPLATYLPHPQTLHFLISDATVLAGIEMNLPGLFADRPFTAVNGSLWTLVYEMKMYLLLLLVWAVSAKQTRGTIRTWFRVENILLGLCLSSGLMLVIKSCLGDEAGHLNRFIFLFFSGASFYSFKKYIPLSHRIFLCIVVTAGIAFLFGKTVFSMLVCLAIPYTVLYLAFIPNGIIRQFNKMGDYSYGVYIYAFPIQQSIGAIYPKISVSQLAISSLTLTFIMAAFSWHVIEKPVLSNKNRTIESLQWLLARLTLRA